MASRNRKQAERCTKQHAELHAMRQRNMGELMIGDNDRPSRWDLLATLVVVGIILVGSMRGWW